MTRRLIVILEHLEAEPPQKEPAGAALARVAEAHPVLQTLLDFAPPDPQEIARQVGVSYAYDPDDAADLEEIDWGPEEWFEPAAGLAAVRHALDRIRASPESIAAAIYDPGLRAADVIADLERWEVTLRGAQDQETRFRLAWRAEFAP